MAADTTEMFNESGNVFDRRYRDGLPEWRAGRYFEIGTEPAAEVLILQSP